jgi:hypothetical protein
MPKNKPMSVEELSPAAQTVVKDHKYAGQQSFKDLLRLLKELAFFDAQTDALYAAARKRMGVYIVLACLCGFGMFFIIPFSTGLGKYAVIPIAAVVVLLIVFIVLAVVNSKKAKALKLIDLANDFRLSLIPFLDELGEDADPKARVKVSLDFAGMVDAKITINREIPPGRWRKVTQTVYQDPWCHLALELEDDNLMVLDIKNQVIKIHREWRNPRGKSKSKTKYNKMAAVSASIIPDAKDAVWDDAKIQERASQDKVKVADKKDGRVCRLTRKWKFKTVNEEPNVGVAPNEIVGMFMQLYAMLRPAEQRS